MYTIKSIKVIRSFLKIYIHADENVATFLVLLYTTVYTNLMDEVFQSPNLHTFSAQLLIVIVTVFDLPHVFGYI